MLDKARMVAILEAIDDMVRLCFYEDRLGMRLAGMR